MKSLLSIMLAAAIALPLVAQSAPPLFMPGDAMKGPIDALLLEAVIGGTSTNLCWAIFGATVSVTILNPALGMWFFLGWTATCFG